MLVVTNRNLLPAHTADDTFKDRCFGDTFNARGPDELRLAHARMVDNRWRVTLIREAEDVNRSSRVMLPSERAFLRTQRRAQRHNRHIVFFVHGYNNDLTDVLTGAASLKDSFDVEPIVFTWPANGGGLRGLLSYRDDKREARLSVNALDRCLEKLARYLHRHAEHRCDLTINLLAHSMGCYLLKSLMQSSVYQRETLIFDNIILAAADTNNDDHAHWVNRMARRGRVYITINEHDRALRASRLKLGERQKARLGQYPHNLSAEHAVYMDFTDAAHVGASHAYFEGDALRNANVKKVFGRALHGGRAERDLSINPVSGAFGVE